MKDEENKMQDENIAEEEKPELEEYIIDECLDTIGKASDGTVQNEENEVEDTRRKLKEMEEKCNELTDQYQRMLAEFDNFRKRTSKEKASMYDDGVRDTITKLLPVIDNLDRAVAAQEKNGDSEDPFYKGVLMTRKSLQEILSSMGVEEIKAMGEKFDPNFHAAVAHEDDESYGESEIIFEMLKGYVYKDKVIRHSMVKVAN